MIGRTKKDLSNVLYEYACTLCLRQDNNERHDTKDIRNSVDEDI